MTSAAAGRRLHPVPEGMPRPRVLLLITSDHRRGAESFAAVLAEQLAVRGFDTRLRSLCASGLVPSLPVPALGPSPLAARTLWRLRREILASDLVVACGSRTLPASVLAGLGAHRPVIYQNIGDPLYWAPRGLRRARVRALLKRTKGVAALSVSSAEVLASSFGVPPHQVRVIPNARDSTLFRPAEPGERSRVRRELQLGQDEVVVAMVAALSPEKRVDLAISAVGGLTSHIRLVVAGDGPLRTELERHAAAVAPGRVTFLGARDDLASVLRGMDALVLTSDSEGSPGVLIEAGLSGLPVVSTDVGYIRDIVADGRTGCLVPPGDVQALAIALERVVEDKGRMGAAARRRCVEKFDLMRVCQQWADLLRQALQAG